MIIQLPANYEISALRAGDRIRVAYMRADGFGHTVAARGKNEVLSVTKTSVVVQVGRTLTQFDRKTGMARGAGPALAAVSEMFCAQAKAAHDAGAVTSHIPGYPALLVGSGEY